MHRLVLIIGLWIGSASCYWTTGMNGLYSGYGLHWPLPYPRLPIGMRPGGRSDMTVRYSREDPLTTPNALYRTNVYLGDRHPYRPVIYAPQPQYNIAMRLKTPRQSKFGDLTLYELLDGVFLEPYPKLMKVWRRILSNIPEGLDSVMDLIESIPDGKSFVRWALEEVPEDVIDHFEDRVDEILWDLDMTDVTPKVWTFLERVVDEWVEYNDWI